MFTLLFYGWQQYEHTTPFTMSGFYLAPKEHRPLQFMENQNLEQEALEKQDNQEQEADHLLAGKFKSKQSLIESTAELVKQVEGRDMTPTEVLALNDKQDEELEQVYKGLERQFHTARPPKTQDVENENDEMDEAFKVLDKWAADRGYVRKDQLDAERYEEQELNTYLAQNEAAKGRLDLIKTLAKTDDFKNKSYAEIDQFILDKIPQAESAANIKPKMGNSLEGQDDWSPESIREQIKNAPGAIYR